MEIEEVVVIKFEWFVKVLVNVVKGVDLDFVWFIVEQGYFLVEVFDIVVVIIVKLWEFFVVEDVMLVEVNLLVWMFDYKIFVLDVKIIFDGNVDFCQFGYVEFED